VKTLHLETVDIVRVDLISVPVPLPDDLGSTIELANGGPLRVGLEDGRAESQSHRTSEVRLADLGHEDDDRVGSRLHKLSRVGLCG
jgi:hypothetical protein